MVEYIVEAISTLEWPANATAITMPNFGRDKDLCCEYLNYFSKIILRSEDCPLLDVLIKMMSHM